MRVDFLKSEDAMKKIIFLIQMLFLAFIISCDSDSDSGSAGGGADATGNENIAPIFLSAAPIIAQVDMEYRYDAIVIDPDGQAKNLTVKVSADDTCGGVIAAKKFAQGDYTYTFTPGAAQVNTQCVVGLTASDGDKKTNQDTTIDIGDENAAPYFTSTAPTTATEDVLYTYNITVADDNVPPQSLTITLGPLDICGGVVADNGDGTGTYTVTPNEVEGGLSCLVSLTVTDSMAASVAQNSIVDVTEDNKAPVNNAPANASGDKFTLISFDISPTDADVPAQSLSCSIVTNDCGGGALNGCVFEWVPGLGDEFDACDVVTVVNDGFADSVEVTTTVTVGIDMVYIPSGCFDMGDSFSEGGSNELPVHNVCITSAFEMSRHEVTVGEYKACVAAGGCTAPANMNSFTRANYYDEASGLYDNYPVIYVNWFDAEDYCSWIGGRLPTEAEWEYAARGGLTGKRYPWGDAISGTDANYWDSGDPWDNDTSPVEYYAPNGYGLYDMAGNVWEWVNDWYDQDYYQYCEDNSIVNDPQGPTAGTSHVLRGGCWVGGSNGVRASDRSYLGPGSWGSAYGFRCVRD